MQWPEPLSATLSRTPFSTTERSNRLYLSERADTGCRVLSGSGSVFCSFFGPSRKYLRIGLFLGALCRQVLAVFLRRGFQDRSGGCRTHQHSRVPCDGGFGRAMISNIFSNPPIAIWSRPHIISGFRRNEQLVAVWAQDLWYTYPNVSSAVP